MIKETKTISKFVANLTQKTFIVGGFFQILVIAMVMSIFAYNDASNRARFLAQANQNVLGLMLATGDLFQIKSIISSFKTKETPQIWLLDENGMDLLAGNRTPHLIGDEVGRVLQWKNWEVFLKIEHPISYNGVQYGKLILLNKIRTSEWAMLFFLILCVNMTLFFVQGRVLEKFSKSVANSIFDLSTLFSYATSKEDLQAFASTRKNTEFLEIETMGVRIIEILSSMLQSSELEKEKEKYKTISKLGRRSLVSLGVVRAEQI